MKRIFISFIAFVGLLLAGASCVQFDQPIPMSGDEITFGAAAFQVETKASSGTSETTFLSSFYVSAVTGSAGSEESAFTSTQFTQIPSSNPAVYKGSKFWPSSDQSWKFYASNAPLTFDAAGTTVAATNTTDVVCAYLTNGTYKTKNTLTFEHIFARFGRVDVVAEEGYTISDISIRITPKTGGTYNLRTGAGQTDGTGWSSVTTGSPTVVASQTGANGNDIYLVPGTYSMTATWTATNSGVSVTYTDRVVNVPAVAGKTNIYSVVLGGEIMFGVDLVEYCNYDYRDNLDYLTFYCDEAGTIGWKCSSSSDAKTIQYSKNFGATWTNLSSTTSGARIYVSAGDIVWFKGSNARYEDNNFTLSNKAHVYGNVNSLTGNNTSVSSSCFERLFNNCSSLYTYEHKKIILPATTLANYCYSEMFAGCTSLASAPELPATTLANSCYSSMFSGCSSLTAAPELPATTLVKSCYNNMFRGCTSFTVAPELPATTMQEKCYNEMFTGCTSLTAAPELPATTLAISCYQSMFSDCSSLTSAPELPATTLVSKCYQNMFTGCTSLTAAPELPATTLASLCYSEMFQGCSSLNYIKALFTTTPSSTYTNNWVSGVAATGTFVKSLGASWDVTGDNGVPTGWTVERDDQREKIIFGVSCEDDVEIGDPIIFKLTVPEDLTGEVSVDVDGWDTGTAPVEDGISVITISSVRPDDGTCISAGVHKCTVYHPGDSNYKPSSEVVEVTLSKRTLSPEEITMDVYTDVDVLIVDYTGPNDLCSYGVVDVEAGEYPLSQGGVVISSNGCTLGYINLTDGSGQFIYPEVQSFFDVNFEIEIYATFLGDGMYEPVTVSKVIPPSAWDSDAPLTFEVVSAGTITWKSTDYVNYNKTEIEYSKNGGVWTLLSPSTSSGASFSVAAGDVVRFRGYNDCYAGEDWYAYFSSTAKVRAYGDVCSLLSASSRINLHPYAFRRLFLNMANMYSHPSEKLVIRSSFFAECCFEEMFRGCTHITSGPELTEWHVLAYACCKGMFYGCASLVNAPVLPATSLRRNCYENMFYGCTSLVNAPELPAESLAESCYSSMFYGCTSLAYAPELPALNIPNNGYYQMFRGCTSLVTAPDLPAPVINTLSYGYMFYGCTGLVNAPEIIATTMNGSQNMQYMFGSCTSLVDPPALPARTLRSQCYRYMFYGCTSLRRAPELPVTTLASYCYQYMFQNCSSLTTAPVLPATTLASYCYQYMFSGCSSLNYIKALFTTTPSSTYTANWVSGVAATGTFVKSAAATWNVTGNNGVPTGWTVQTASN